VELKLNNQRYRQTHPSKERAHAERGRLNFEIGGFKNWRFSDPKSKAKRFICIFYSCIFSYKLYLFQI
jgi:hypothetical protein